MITTTLARIRAHGPCMDGWEKLLRGLGKTVADDEPLPFSKIVEINGLADALWCLRVEPQHRREWRLFMVWCVRRIQHLMKNPHSIAALDVAERHANGQATDEELANAHRAASAAVPLPEDLASFSARFSVRFAAQAAKFATVATEDAPWGISLVVSETLWSIEQAVSTATLAAAAGWTAWYEREAQKKKFLEIVG